MLARAMVGVQVEVDPSVSEALAWEQVVQEAPRLRRYAARVAHGFRGLDVEEIYQALCLDLVENRAQWDASRGPWGLWAWMRARLTALRQRRVRDHQEPGGRESIGSGELNDDGQSDGCNPELGVGHFGSAARSETAIELYLVERGSTSVEREILVCLLLGLDEERTTGLRRKDRDSIKREQRRRIGQGEHLIRSRSGLHAIRGERGWGWGDLEEASAFTRREAREILRELDPAGERGLRIVGA
jgi:hypothetical protein